MKIRRTESYLLEADSVEAAEEQYAADWNWCEEAEFESIQFTEVKEQTEMNEVTISVEEYAELVKKAHSFDIIREKERDNKYLDSFERAIFGFEKPEPKGVVVVEDDF